LLDAGSKGVSMSKNRGVGGTGVFSTDPERKEGAGPTVEGPSVPAAELGRNRKKINLLLQLFLGKKKNFQGPGVRRVPNWGDKGIPRGQVKGGSSYFPPMRGRTPN